MQRLVTALLLIFLSGSALAQNLTPLPPNVVWGRLGAGQSGPGQAIPFATLGVQLQAALAGGAAKMFPHVGQTTSASDCYTMVDPYGNAITCTTSTQSQGLQEFLNATTSNGWPAVVYCEGVNFPAGTEPVYIQANTSVTVPVAQNWSFHSYGCNLNFSVSTVSGLILDSEGASVFDWDGQVVYNVTSPNGNSNTSPSCAVLIQPTTNTEDGFAALYAGFFRMKSITVNASGGTATGAACFNASNGNLIQHTYDFSEVNVNNQAYFGIMIFGATGSTGFQQNRITAQQIHGSVLEAVNEGYSAANQVNYNSNQWIINNIQNNGASSRGIDTYGSLDDFQIGIINNVQGGLQYGIVTESGSVANKFRYGSVSGASTAAILDSGTCNSFNGKNFTSAAIFGLTSGCTKLQTTPTVPSNQQAVILPSLLAPMAPYIGALQ